MLRFHLHHHHQRTTTTILLLTSSIRPFHHSQNNSHFTPTLGANKRITQHFKDQVQNTTNTSSHQNRNQKRTATTSIIPPRVVSWKCSTCQYINPAVVEHCSLCGDPFKGDNSEELTVVNQKKKFDKEYFNRLSLKNNDAAKQQQEEETSTENSNNSNLDLLRQNEAKRIVKSRDTRNNVYSFFDNTDNTTSSSSSSLEATNRNTTSASRTLDTAQMKNLLQDQKRGFRLHSAVEHFDWLCENCHTYNNSTDRTPTVKCTSCRSLGPSTPYHWRCGKCCKISTSLPAQDGKCTNCEDGRFAALVKCSNCHKPVSAFGTEKGKKCRFCKEDLDASAEKMIKWMAGQKAEHEERIVQRQIQEQKQVQREKEILEERQQRWREQKDKEYAERQRHEEEAEKLLNVQEQEQETTTYFDGKPMRQAERRIAEKEKKRLQEQQQKKQQEEEVEQPSSSPNEMPMLEDDEPEVTTPPSPPPPTPQFNDFTPGRIESWVCSECGDCNQPSTASCPSCGAMKPASSSSSSAGMSETSDYYSETHHQVHEDSTKSKDNDRDDNSLFYDSSPSSSSPVQEEQEQQLPNWRCVSCGNSVSASQESCPICLQPKPEEQQKQNSTSVNYNINNINNTPNKTSSSSSSTWNCPLCRTENFSQRRVCRICSVECGKGKQHSEIVQTLSLYPQKPSDVACPPSQFQQETSNIISKEEHNENANGIMSSVDTSADSSTSSSSFWSCVSCSEKSNPMDSPVCIRCDQPRIVKDVETLLAEQEEAERKDNNSNASSQHPMMTAEGRPLRKTWLCSCCLKWNSSVKPHQNSNIQLRCRHCQSDPAESTRNSIWLCRSESCTRTHSDRLSLAMEAGVFEYLSSSGNNNNATTNDESDTTTANLPTFHIVRSHCWNWGFSISCSHCGEFRKTEESPSIPFGWSCSECGSTSGGSFGSSNNNAGNKKCRECGAPPAFAGDWKCSTCSAVNFSRRLACRRCSKTRTDESSTAVLSARRWFRQAMERKVKLEPLVFVDSENYPILVAQEKERALMMRTAANGNEQLSNNNNSGAAMENEQGIVDDDDIDDSDAVNIIENNDEVYGDEDDTQELLQETKRKIAEAEAEAEEEKKRRDIEEAKEKNKDSNNKLQEDEKDEDEEDHSHLFVDGGSAARFYREQQQEEAPVAGETVPQQEEVVPVVEKEVKKKKKSASAQAKKQKLAASKKKKSSASATAAWVCGLCDEPSNPDDCQECTKCGMPRDATEMKV